MMITEVFLVVKNAVFEESDRESEKADRCSPYTQYAVSNGDLRRVGIYQKFTKLRSGD
jgi:hypothetical protein